MARLMRRSRMAIVSSSCHESAFWLSSFSMSKSSYRTPGSHLSEHLLLVPRARGRRLWGRRGGERGDMAFKTKKWGQTFPQGGGRKGGRGRRPPGERPGDAPAGRDRGAARGRATGERTRGRGRGRRGGARHLRHRNRLLEGWRLERFDLTPKCRREEKRLVLLCTGWMLWGLFVLLCILSLCRRAVVPF